MMGMGADLYYSDDYAVTAEELLDADADRRQELYNNADTNIRSNELYFLDDDEFGYDNPLAFDFTDAGAAVMDDMCRGVDALYTVDDAVEKFMEEIDYFRTKIAEIQHGFEVVSARAMEYPTECDWDAEIQKLQWSLIAKQETLDMLESDLSRLLGREVAG